MDSTETSHCDGSWTNEKHISFLNRMEASFVRNMLENDDHRALTCAIDGNLRLDRRLPDCAESTRDFNDSRNKMKALIKIETMEAKNNSGSRGEKRMRNGPQHYRRQPQPQQQHHHHQREKASEDQVVPQMGSRK